MLRYALYTRKSDERREVTEKSTSEQQSECRGLAQGRGTIVREYEESKSAKVPGVRPLFRELLSLIEKGEVNALLCWKVDRLARNMKEGGELAQLLIDGKIREIRTPHACHKPGDNILPFVLDTATSTQYSLDLVTNVVRGLNGHFERGGWNARAPQGYRNDRDLINSKVGIIVTDEPRFTLLRKGWDMMLTGAYSPGQVARTLNEVYGYRTRKTVKQGGTRLSRSHAYELFKNPFYAGYTWYKGELRPGGHPAMVTEAEFNQVQELLKVSMVPHAHTHEFAYTGLMRCGCCGSQITGEMHWIKAAGGTKKPYRFYRCADSRENCTKRGLSEKDVEAAIERALAGITLDPALCDIAEANLLRSLEHQTEAKGVIYAQQNATLEALEGQQSRLLSMWLSGLLTDEGRYQAAEARLAKEKQDLLLKVGACRDELAQMRANVEASFRYLRYARTRFLVGDAPRRREIAKVLAVDYLFYGAEKRVEIALKPLLLEVVRYADEVASILSVSESEMNTPDVGDEALRATSPLAPESALLASGSEGIKTGSHWEAFEPRIIGFGSGKKGDNLPSVRPGRGKETVFEPNIQVKASSHLLEALSSGVFPTLDF